MPRVRSFILVSLIEFLMLSSQGLSLIPDLSLSNILLEMTDQSIFQGIANEEMVRPSPVIVHNDRLIHGSPAFSAEIQAWTAPAR